MAKSFNAFGRRAVEVGALHQPIWLGTVKPVPVGGVLAEAFRIAGALYGAGCPINLANGVITPFSGFKVVSFSAAAGSETVDTVVVKPIGAGIAPKVNDVIQKLGATFAATAKAAKVASVVAGTGSDAGKYTITILHSATIDTVEAGDVLVFSAATAAGSSKSMAAQPNAYLYNDICLGDLTEDINASGAAVKFHGEGLLIDLTPAAEVAAQMAAAVPGVLQVSV